MLKSISYDISRMGNNDELCEGIRKLKDLDLLSGKDINYVKFPGIIKTPHIHNDYHLR